MGDSLMNDVFITDNNIFTSLGNTTNKNIENIKNDISGIKLINDIDLSPIPVFLSVINNNVINNDFSKIGNIENYTKLEKMFILSINNALENSKIDIKSDKTLIIISTTKGNIDLLGENIKNNFSKDRVYIPNLASEIQLFFKNPNKPIIISHACISGISAILVATKLIQSKQYENIVVSGGDILSKFVVSGFQSFQAISNSPCKPFDEQRNGITLGEGCGTIILTSDLSKTNCDSIKLIGGSISNDANHISGPSRTGDGLYIAIRKTLIEANKNSSEIDYVSAHGTATLYNDEMEAKAFTLAGLNDVPVNSLKGYFGHTLGAAGIIESIVTITSMKENLLYNSIGYNKLGVTEKLNIINKLTPKKINIGLKTGSGFGGCNASVLFSK